VDEHASFGVWLQRRRRALDLTQAELAERVGCALGTIRKLETDERRPSKQLAARLAEQLQLAPEEQAVFLKAARAEVGVDRLGLPALFMPPPPAAPGPMSNFAPPQPRDAHRTNLPTRPTPLIGRERESAALVALLRRDDVRLITLSGPGGAGKTRLALHAATALLNDFADGSYIVNLAPISDPDLVAPTIAHALGMAEGADRPVEAGLRAFLHGKQMLLLLDNFEQVLDAAPLIAELLAAAPGLKLLVTSRAVLHLYGEHEVVVPPLALPPPSDVPVSSRGEEAREVGGDVATPAASAAAALLEYAAVRLFSVRAQAARADFTLTSTDAPIVAEICRRLDGLPLAIELAAAHIKFFAPAALLMRLEDRLELLAGGPRDLPMRQQTMRNTIDWSYHLLDAGEQVLFRRLGVFVRGCTLQAAAAVCHADGALALDPGAGLAALTNKSLLQQSAGPDGEPRFTMLETVRGYALELLTTCGEAAAVRQRHAAYYLALAEQSAEASYGKAELASYEQLEHELDNLRAALDWCHAQPGAAAIEIRLATALAQCWVIRGYAREWWERMQAALLRRSEVPEALRARALIISVLFLIHGGGDPEQVAPFVAEGLTLKRMLGDTTGTAWALMAQGTIAAYAGDYRRAARLNEQSLSLYQALNNPWGQSIAHFQLGELALLQGDQERAGALLEQSVTLYRQSIGATWAIARRLTWLGLVVLAQGDVVRAGALFRESLTLCSSSRNKVDLPMTLVGLAGVAQSQGRPEAAARLLGAADALSRTVGSYRGLIGGLITERTTAAVRDHLDNATFAVRWAEGQRMSLEQAQAEALGKRFEG
jgi:predicted ATPase/transcriptional regulator with XRE-family HTH domain